ncbi:MAG: ClpXP protease specificity-enhancing factor [Thiotrichales bacterium]|nr:ClpXP protease specificity-enhancing factor [Thiotrichales bacterium]
MISTRPYLIRAIYDWIVDNGWTPHLQVDADYPGTQVPPAFVENGKIVLNVNPTAVAGLELGNEQIVFFTRFHGVEETIVVPPEAVLAVFARENGQGMPFAPVPYDAQSPQAQKLDDPARARPNALETSTPSTKASSKTGKKRPTLTVVK